MQAKQRPFAGIWGRVGEAAIIDFREGEELRDRDATYRGSREHALSKHSLLPRGNKSDLEAMKGEAKGNFIPFLTMSAVVEPEPRGLDNRLLRIIASGIATRESFSATGHKHSTIRIFKHHGSPRQ